MNWREQFDNAWTQNWPKDQLEAFISTEIIGKLISEIPDEHSAGMFLTSNMGIKQQLRNKWLQ
jgi:hypothetical protein